MTLVLRSLLALLPLTVVALWLAPAERDLGDAPALHAAQTSPSTAAAPASPPPLAGPCGEVEAEDDDRGGRPPSRRHRQRAAGDRAPTDLEPTTRARSAEPLYTVRRSGQAHRSAP